MFQHLPKGLELHRQGVFNSVLLYSPETHIWQYYLDPGQSLPRFNAQDIMYLLKGSIHLASRQLPVGSYIYGEDLNQSLRSSVPLRMLRFSTYPQLQPVISETVHFEAGSIQLLFSGDAQELSLMTLKNDMRMFIVPPDKPSTKEFYHLLEGELSFHHHQDYTLSPGDSIVAQGLEAPVVFKALKDTQLLFFSTQPAFDVVSHDIQGLMQLAEDIEKKDGYTANHCARIQTLALRTAEYMDLDHQRIYLLSYAAYLHDIGKIKIPLDILQKPGKLSLEEWQIMKQHPSQGKNIIKDIFPDDVALMVEQHHEHWDGSGYPKGLKGQDILSESFIIAIADAFDAMTTDRSYRKALDKAYAIEELRRFADIHYPQTIIEAFIKANSL